MTKGSIVVAAVLSACLGGCETEAVPEGAEIGVDTIPDPVVTDATQRIPLRDMVGANLTGEVMVTPLADSVVFRVELNGVGPETTYGVRVQPGSCESPGQQAAILAAVRTGALGNGTSHGAVYDDWQRFLNGRHVVAIYAPAADPGADRPVACAQLPAM